jgi:hypothetical protein
MKKFQLMRRKILTVCSNDAPEIKICPALICFSHDEFLDAPVLGRSSAGEIRQRKHLSRVLPRKISGIV